jgi:hypothetical protein
VSAAADDPVAELVAEVESSEPGFMLTAPLERLDDVSALDLDAIDLTGGEQGFDDGFTQLSLDDAVIEAEAEIESVAQLLAVADVETVEETALVAELHAVEAAAVEPPSVAVAAAAIDTPSFADRAAADLEVTLAQDEQVAEPVAWLEAEPATIESASDPAPAEPAASVVPEVNDETAPAWVDLPVAAAVETAPFVSVLESVVAVDADLADASGLDVVGFEQPEVLAVPETIEAAETVVVVEPAPPPAPVLAPVVFISSRKPVQRSPLPALERLLRKVEARRLQLRSETVA